MPKAKGLFHKAVSLSGSTVKAMDQKASQSLGEYILKEAGLNTTDVDKLQDMPWKDYLELANKAAKKFAAENTGTGVRGGFSPVADGINIPKGQFFAEPNGLSSDVPMIINTNFHEWGMARTMPEMELITADKAKEMLKERAGMGGGLGDKAGVVYDAYAKIYPSAKPIEILTLVSSNRKGAIETADAKASQKAPVYVSWFGWEPPMFDHRMRAFHCLDICFWYANTDLMLTHTGGGKRPRALSEKMSGALLQFMKTGNPNGGGLPEWKAYTTAKGETLVINDHSELKNDPDREARKLI
jgi:para-nitrobenzyl esterase